MLEIPNDNDQYHRELFENWVGTMVKLWDRFFSLISVTTTDGSYVDPQIGLGGDVALPIVSKKKPTAKPSSLRNLVTSTAVAVANSSGSPESTNAKRTPSVSLVVRQVSGGRKRSPAPKSNHPPKQAFRSLNFRRSQNLEADRTTPSDQQSNTTTSQDGGGKSPQPPITKESIVTNLEASFLELETVGEMSDLEEMQSLLILVSDAVKQVSPFRDDTELQAQLLNFVLPKLTDEVVQRFEAHAEEEHERSLHLLKKCLVQELIEYYNSLKETAGGDDKICYYCKEVGHLR